MTHRLKSFLQVLKEAWPLWAAVGVGIAFLISLIFISGWSARIRITGMLLQLFGLGTVALGIRKVRKNFSLPTLRQSMLPHLEKTFGRSEPEVFEGSVSFNAKSAVKVTNSEHEAPQGAPLERRIDLLGTNLRRLRKETNEKLERVNSRATHVEEVLQEEQTQRTAEIESTRQLVEDVAAGGLRLERVGLVWLLLGVLGTSMPDEIINIVLTLFR